MGRVFTFQEIVDGRVATLKAHELVSAKLPERLMKCPGIIGAVGLGSTLRGDFNRRSDHDWVVLYKAALKRQAREYLRDLCALAMDQRSVEISFIQCTDEVARTRFHHMGPVFQAHFAPYWKQFDSAWVNPVTILATSVPFKEEIEGYLRVKLYSLQHGYTELDTHEFGSKSHVRFLRKLLEAPVHIARRMLLYSYDTLADDSKSVVVAEYGEKISTPLGQRLLEYVALDQWYTAKLEEQLTSPDRTEYHWVLRDIAQHGQEIIDFFEENIKLLNEREAR